MTAPAALAPTDVHRAAATVRTRLGQLLVILVDDALMTNLPAAPRTDPEAAPQAPHQPPPPPAGAVPRSMVRDLVLGLRAPRR